MEPIDFQKLGATKFYGGENIPQHRPGNGAGFVVPVY
jgi:hypothetical protein